MINAPLHERLAGLHAALATGAPIEPYGATVDNIRGLVTIRTARGPAYFHLRDLATIARASAPATVHQVAPLPMAAPIRPKVASKPAPAKAAPLTKNAGPWLPLERTWAWQEWRKKDRPGTAPRRAVGNFTDKENTARTLEALRHNLTQARASGNEALIKVMERAMSDALTIANGLNNDPKRRKLMRE